MTTSSQFSKKKLITYIETINLTMQMEWEEAHLITKIILRSQQSQIYWIPFFGDLGVLSIIHYACFSVEGWEINQIARTMSCGCLERY